MEFGVNVDQTATENVRWIFYCLFDGSLVENDTKSDGKSIIFLGNAMKIP